MKIDENAAMLGLETACPGLDYVLILVHPVTKEVVQVGTFPPALQASLMRHNLEQMEIQEPEVIDAPKIKHND